MEKFQIIGAVILKNNTSYHFGFEISFLANRYLKKTFFFLQKLLFKTIKCLEMLKRFHL